MKKINILILFISLIHIQLFSQADVKLSSFFITPLIYNPAYAGSYEGLTFTSFYTSQWVGFDGAPKTIYLNGHGTFLNRNTGLGFEVFHDEIGATSNTKILGNYSYQIMLNKQWRLSLGLKAGFSWYDVNYARLNIQDTNETYSIRNVKSINVNFGAGFILHNEKFYFGIGVPNLLKPNIVNVLFDNTSFNIASNYYLSSGFRFLLQEDVFFSPAILIRAVKGAPLRSLFAATLNWEEQFYLSINMNINSTVGGYVGLRFKEKFLLGYSYDTSINRFSSDNKGNHSFFLNLRLNDFWKRKRCGCYNF